MQNFLKTIVILFIVIISPSCTHRKVEKYYYSNGNIKEEHSFVNDKLNGISTFYYENGRKYSVANYLEGLQDGLTMIYYPSGHLEEINHFRNGVIIDTQKVFYENGNIRELSYLVNGEKNGEMRMYYMNGMLYKKGNVYMGYQDSVWDTFDSIKGSIIDISRYYKNGLKRDSLPKEELQIDSFNVSGFKFTLMIPYNWKVYVRKKKQFFAVSNVQYPGDVFPPNMTIIDTNIVVNDLKEYIDKMIEAMPQIKGISLKEVISRKKGLIDNHKAEEVIWTSNNNNAACISTLVVVGNVCYTINCIVPAKRLFLYLDLYREIMNSIKFRKNGLGAT
jgi:hypothetical protein